MTKKQKVFLFISLAELCTVILMVVIFNLPCSKAVTWKSASWETGEIAAVNTKGRTNFSEQINKELNDFPNRWDEEIFKTPHDAPDYVYRPNNSFTVVSNTSNLCIVRIHRTICEINRVVPINGLKVGTIIGEEIFDYYIYIDSKNNSIITRFETVKDTFPYNDDVQAANDA